MNKKKYKTIHGEIIEYDAGRADPRALAFLLRIQQAANDPNISEKQMEELIYLDKNPIMEKGPLGDRGWITKKVLNNPLYDILTDLVYVKMKQVGKYDPEKTATLFSVSVPGAAEQLGITQSAIRAAIQAKKLSAIKKGGQHWINPNSIESYKKKRGYRKYSARTWSCLERSYKIFQENWCFNKHGRKGPFFCPSA